MKRLIVAIVVMLAGLVLAAQVYPVMPQGVQGPYLVLKVVDGDTIHVSANGQKLKIPMIGLDMPEGRRPDTALPNHHASMAGRSVGGTG
jgi:hypothetical protein